MKKIFARAGMDEHLPVTAPTGGELRDVTPHRAPRVSVVMPVCNAAAFLEEAVRSVLEQTYGSWELLLIDDGSTDGSRALAERFAAEHPARIRCLHHPNNENRGASATRNLGISHARGEYLALLDADDVWLPGKLEKQVVFLDLHPEVAAVGSWYQEVNIDGGLTGDADLPCSHPDIAWALLCYCPFVHSSVMMRRGAVGEHVGWYDEALATAEDWDLWIRISRHFELANLPEFLVRYRVHEASLSATKGRREGPDRGLRESTMTRMLDWYGDPPDARRQRSRAVAFLVLGWADSPDPDGLLSAVGDLHRLHDVFCREANLSEHVRRSQRRQLNRQIASALLTFSSQLREERPRDAQALFAGAVRAHFPAVLWVRTWTRMARLLMRRIRLSKTGLSATRK